jgi:hypothetical protein
MLRYYILCLVNVKAKGNDEAESSEAKGERVGQRTWSKPFVFYLMFRSITLQR